MSQELLPLFPLQLVLFPGSSLPLHIFEERYKILINKCIEETKEFGINLFHHNEFQKVGCTAVVTSVTQRYDDGRMDIIVLGRRRYTLLRYDVGRAPYMVGQVQFFVAMPERINKKLAEATVRLYNELVERVYKQQVPQIRIESYEPGLSFVLAQKAGMDLLQRQRLLESTSENERLKMLSSYLSGVIPKLERLGEIERIIQSDGYLT